MRTNQAAEQKPVTVGATVRIFQDGPINGMAGVVMRETNGKFSVQIPGMIGEKVIAASKLSVI